MGVKGGELVPLAGIKRPIRRVARLNSDEAAAPKI